MKKTEIRKPFFDIVLTVTDKMGAKDVIRYKVGSYDKSLLRNEGKLTIINLTMVIIRYLVLVETLEMMKEQIHKSQNWLHL